MNARDILFYGNRTLMEGLERVPPSERTTPGLIGWWSAREAMAHLAIFEQLLADYLAGFMDNAPVHEHIAQMSPQLNDILVAQKAGKSFDDLLGEYHQAHARVMELIETIPTEKLREVGTLPWYGDIYSLDDFLVYTYYGHKREHTARFEAFADQLQTIK
jgi:hypothetical protein